MGNLQPRIDKFAVEFLKPNGDIQDRSIRSAYLKDADFASGVFQSIKVDGPTVPGYVLTSVTGDGWATWTGTVGGTSGFSGFSGYSSSSGYSGYSGATVSGYSGYSGKSGYSGVGLSGFSGYSGTGLSGFSGYSGTSTSGYSGYIGGSGYSGYSGASGYSGDAPGTSGFSGYSGVSGYSGDKGAPGPDSGYSGYSAYSGYSGATGPQGISGYSGATGTSAETLATVTTRGNTTTNSITVRSATINSGTLTVTGTLELSNLSANVNMFQYHDVGSGDAHEFRVWRHNHAAGLDDYVRIFIDEFRNVYFRSIRSVFIHAGSVNERANVQIQDVGDGDVILFAGLHNVDTCYFRQYGYVDALGTGTHVRWCLAHNGNFTLDRDSLTIKKMQVNMPFAVTSLSAYPNNASAVAGGLAVGDFYRTGADPDHVCVVH